MSVIRWLVVLAAVAAACIFIVYHLRARGGSREKETPAHDAPPSGSRAADPAAQTRLRGRIVGYDCHTTGRGCPKDRDDPIVAMERDFVLVTAPDSHYLLPDVDRATKLRLVTQEVTVYGQLDPRYRSLAAERIEADDVVVWARGASASGGWPPGADPGWDGAVEEQRGGRANAPGNATDPTLKNLYGGH